MQQPKTAGQNKTADKNVPVRPALTNGTSQDMPETPAGRTGGRKRPLLIHYHLFKNAGSSIDAVLSRNFPKTWCEKEFPLGTPHVHQVLAVHELLQAQPGLRAISSHTLLFPVPRFEGRDIIPVVFVRHPIDRIKSAYDFQRRVNDPRVKDVELAKRLDFRDYLKTCLQNPADRHCRNFQTRRLSAAVPGPGSDLDRALRAVKMLQFIGLVEEFDKSMTALKDCISNSFPKFRTFPVHPNPSQLAQVKSLDEKLDKIQKELGHVFYDEICRENEADLALFQYVCKIYRPARA